MDLGLVVLRFWGFVRSGKSKGYCARELHWRLVLNC